MNAIATRPAKSTAISASAACSPELWKLLTGREPNYLDNTARVARDPALKAEVIAALPDIVRLAAPCGPKFVIGALMPLVAVFGVGDRSQAEWAAFWRFYTDALSDMPAEAVTAGIKAYVHKPDSEFFPKPGPLRALVEEAGHPVICAKRRAQVMAEAEAQRPDQGDTAYRHYLLALNVEIQNRSVA